MISSNWCSIQDKLGYAAVKNNPKLSVAQNNKGFFCSCCVSIEGKLQPLLHVIIPFSLWNPVTVWNVAGPKAERKELWRFAFFFFFFFNTESLGRFLFILCFFLWGSCFGYTPRHLWSLFNQGSDSRSLHWKGRVNHPTNREVSGGFLTSAVSWPQPTIWPTQPGIGGRKCSGNEGSASLP